MVSAEGIKIHSCLGLKGIKTLLLATLQYDDCWIKTLLRSSRFSKKRDLLHILRRKVKNCLGEEEVRYFWLQKNFFMKKCAWCRNPFSNKELISTSGYQRDEVCNECVNQFNKDRTTEKMHAAMRGESPPTPGITLHGKDPDNIQPLTPISLDYVWDEFNRISQVFLINDLQNYEN